MRWVALSALCAVGQQMAGQKERSIEDPVDSHKSCRSVREMVYRCVYWGVFSIWMLKMKWEPWLTKITLNLKIFLHLIFCSESCVSNAKVFCSSLL